MDIHDSISLSQEAMHCFLKLGKPVANVSIGTVGSIQAFIPIGKLKSKPRRRIGGIRTIDHMGNIASDLEEWGQKHTRSYQDPCMKPSRRISKRLVVHCSVIQTECKSSLPRRFPIGRPSGRGLG